MGDTWKMSDLLAKTAADQKLWDAKGNVAAGASGDIPEKLESYGKQWYAGGESKTPVTRTAVANTPVAPAVKKMSATRGTTTPVMEKKASGMSEENQVALELLRRKIAEGDTTLGFSKVSRKETEAELKKRKKTASGKDKSKSEKDSDKMEKKASSDLLFDQQRIQKIAGLLMSGRDAYTEGMKDNLGTNALAGISALATGRAAYGTGKELTSILSKLPLKFAERGDTGLRAWLGSNAKKSVNALRGSGLKSALMSGGKFALPMAGLTAALGMLAHNKNKQSVPLRYKIQHMLGLG